MKIVQSLFSFVAFYGLWLAVNVTMAVAEGDGCAYNTYMCCWTKNDGDGMQDNTDVCRVLDSPEYGNTLEFPGDSEGEVHCHGFVWAEGASYDLFIKPLRNFVRHFDHRDARGYHGRVEGVKMCDCIEEMPVVSRADCTTYSPHGLVPCENNDLRTHYVNEMDCPGGGIDFNLVGTCDNQDCDP